MKVRNVGTTGFLSQEALKKSFKQTVGLNDGEFTGRMVVQSYEPALLGRYSLPSSL